MSDDKKKDGVSGIERARKSTAISRVEALEEVGKVAKTGSVGKASGASIDSAATQQMTYADREKILGMVDEEAQKLFGTSKLPPSQKKIIADAVKMAIDSSLVPEGDEEEASEETS